MWPAALVGATCTGLAGLPQAQALSEQERAAVCDEAQTRYRELFGKSPQQETARVVLMFKDTFCPSSMTVPQGTTVRWVNVDKRTSHSVWFKEAGRAESDRLFSEETVEITIDWPAGDYPYLCGPHWQNEGMIGRITVTGR